MSSCSLDDIPASIPDHCQNVVACGRIGSGGKNPSVKVRRGLFIILIESIVILIIIILLFFLFALLLLLS